MQTVVERARPDDVDDLFEFLRQNGLPIDGLRDHLQTTLIARRDGRLVGSAALEIYAEGALLRSVAVAPDLRGQGLGRDLTAAAVVMAREAGIRALYLLTTTAEGYFPKFGFERVDRTDVPVSVQTSVEFTSACPASAVVMRNRL